MHGTVFKGDRTVELRNFEDPVPELSLDEADEAYREFNTQGGGKDMFVF
jgi:hypothetical protein